MKAFKVLGTVVIVYFILVVSDRVVALGDAVSRGNIYVEYAYYFLLAALAFYFVLLPLAIYMKKPSMATFSRLAKGDRKAADKIRRYYLKHGGEAQRTKLARLDAGDAAAIRQWAAGYLEEKSTELDKIIKRHALRLTATVMVSPNPFIDGIAVLFGNSRMLYELTVQADLRYSWRDLGDIYFGNFFVSAATGILQEYEEELEELFESLLEEFSEFIGENTGFSVADSVPGLKLLVQSSGPILQAAGNYGYVVFSGSKFKLALLNCIEETPLEKAELRRKARRIARTARYGYIKDMFKNFGAKGAEKFRFNLLKRGRKASERQ